MTTAAHLPWVPEPLLCGLVLVSSVGGSLGLQSVWMCWISSQASSSAAKRQTPSPVGRTRKTVSQQMAGWPAPGVQVPSLCSTRCPAGFSLFHTQVHRLLPGLPSPGQLHWTPWQMEDCLLGQVGEEASWKDRPSGPDSASMESMSTEEEEYSDYAWDMLSVEPRALPSSNSLYKRLKRRMRDLNSP